MAQRETPGPCAARPEVRGPIVARPRAPGPCVARPRAPGPRAAQQGSPEVVPVRRENLHEKDRQVMVAEPPGQSEKRLQLRVRRWCVRGGVGEIRLIKDDVSGDQNAARGEVKASVPLVVRGVPEEHNESSGAPACEKRWRRC